jgi:polyisoprenoid-binding protein YceI
MSPPPGRYRHDPLHTCVRFRVKRLVVGRVDGRFDALEGEFVVLDDRERLFVEIELSLALCVPHHCW